MKPVQNEVWPFVGKIHPIWILLLFFFGVIFVSVMKKLMDGNSVSCNVWSKPSDIERHRYLESQDYKVVRFWNHEMMNDMNGIFHAIEIALGVIINSGKITVAK